MNILQSGTPSSQLEPQSYKNTSQNSAFQDTYNVSGVNQSSSLYQSVNTLQSSGNLRVKSGQSQAVLGASAPASTALPQNATVAQKTSGSLTIALTILVISAILTVFFIRKFRTLLPVEEQ
jgi:hypothetical protein